MPNAFKVDNITASLSRKIYAIQDTNLLNASIDSVKFYVASNSLIYANVTGCLKALLMLPFLVFAVCTAKTLSLLTFFKQNYVCVYS